MDTEKYANQLEDMFINNRLFSFATNTDYMTMKLMEIFRYEELPATINKHLMEYKLLTDGYCDFIRDGDNIIITEQQIKDGEDGIRIQNDFLAKGVQPLISEFGVLTAQAKITLERNLVDLRGNYVITAKDDRTYESALEYMEQIRRGDMAILRSHSFDETEDGVDIYNSPMGQNQATQSVELFNFINSYYYGEFGINLNNNMKREYVNEAELNMNQGAPLLEHMLQSRLFGFMRFNDFFEEDVKCFMSNTYRKEELIDESDNTATTTEDTDGNVYGDGDGTDNTELSTDGDSSGASDEEPATEKVQGTYEEQEHSDTDSEGNIIDTEGEKTDENENESATESD